MPRIEITKIGWLWWVACVVDDYGHSTTLRHGFTAMHARRRCLRAEIRAAAVALPEDGE